MNPGLEKLQQYPFEKLAALKAGVVPPIDLTAIVMSIGEPRHPAPDFVLDAIKQNNQHRRELRDRPKPIQDESILCYYVLF